MPSDWCSSVILATLRNYWWSHFFYWFLWKHPYSVSRCQPKNRNSKINKKKPREKKDQKPINNYALICWTILKIDNEFFFDLVLNRKHHRSSNVNCWLELIFLLLFLFFALISANDNTQKSFIMDAIRDASLRSFLVEWVLFRLPALPSVYWIWLFLFLFFSICCKHTFREIRTFWGQSSRELICLNYLLFFFHCEKLQHQYCIKWFWFLLKWLYDFSIIENGP